MRPIVMILLAALLMPFSALVHAQGSPHPGAEQALARIVLEKDFGDGLKLQSREAVTFATNPQVPGLNGLLFMRWNGADPADQITASVQWFEETSDLLAFYTAERARAAQGLQMVGGTVVWKTSEQSYLWTDGGHFMVSIGGSPAPSKEMLMAWLDLIESNPPDLAPLPSVSP